MLFFSYCLLVLREEINQRNCRLIENFSLEGTSDFSSKLLPKARPALRAAQIASATKSQHLNYKITEQGPVLRFACQDLWQILLQVEGEADNSNIR